MHKRFIKRLKPTYREPLKKSKILSPSAEQLEKLIYLHKDLQKLILRLVITYRMLTSTIVTETKIHSKITGIYNLYCLQIIRKGLNAHTTAFA